MVAVSNLEKLKMAALKVVIKDKEIHPINRIANFREFIIYIEECSLPKISFNILNIPVQR